MIWKKVRVRGGSKWRMRFLCDATSGVTDFSQAIPPPKKFVKINTAVFVITQHHFIHIHLVSSRSSSSLSYSFSQAPCLHLLLLLLPLPLRSPMKLKWKSRFVCA